MIKTTPPRILYQGTVTGLTISAVDGTAFVDNLVQTFTGVTANLSTVNGTAFVTNPSINLAQYPNGTKFTFSDGTNTLIGYKMANGVGETYGGNLFATYDFTTGWVSVGTPTIISPTSFSTTASGHGIKKTSPETGLTPASGLFKLDIAGSATSGTVRSYDTGALAVWITGFGVTGYYTTNAIRGLYFNTTAAATVVISAINAYQVLTPSLSGCTISSTSLGTTPNWTSNSGIDANHATFTLTADMTFLADGTNQLEVYDSSGRMIKGVMKAVGTGETKGSDILTGWDFTLPWSKAAGTETIISATSFSTLGNGGVYHDYSLTPGALYYGTMVSSTSATGVRMASSLSQSAVPSIIADGQTTGYATCSSYGGIYLRNNGAGTTSITSMTLQRVTAPSALGVVVVNSKAGTTYNWAYKNASFTYNQSSYTVVIKKIRGPVVVASGNITAGNALLDLTTANAFGNPVGVDLSPYQDGNHFLRLFLTSSGVEYGRAWISATAPSGEALGPEKCSDPGFTGTIPTNWTSVAWTISAGEGIATAVPSLGSIYQTGAQLLSSIVSGELYKMSFDLTGYTNGSFAARIASQQSGIARTSIGTYTDYLTANSSGVGFGIQAATSPSTGKVDNAHWFKVTMPAATGALLLSSKGGSRGWEFKHASLIGNEALSYQILSSVDTALLTSGKLLGIDTTGSTATWSANYFQGDKFAAAKTGKVTSFKLYVNGNVNGKFAIYSDNAGDVGTQLWVNNIGTALTTGWNTIAVSPPLNVVAGTNYWLGYNLDAASKCQGETTGGNHRYLATQDYTTIGCAATIAGSTTGTDLTSVSAYGIYH